MCFLDGLPINFTISEAAKAEFAVIRRLQLEATGDPPSVLMVGWGTTYFNAGGTAEGVALGYYGASERAGIAHGIETVSGVELIFFILPDDYRRFAGKVLDHRPDRGFFLADPA